MPRMTMTVDESEKEVIRHQAAARGLATSQFLRMCVFGYINQHPAQGVFAALDDIKADYKGKSSERPQDDELRGYMSDYKEEI